MSGLGVGPDDAVVGIAASGRTPFVLGAVEAARRAGALTVGVVCNEATPLAELAEIPIEVLVGPEIVAGSTRLNAGTAQKVVLNIISTAAMVQLGKTYGGLMVDLRATNAKLRDRATRIVAEIAGVPRRARPRRARAVRLEPEERGGDARRRERSRGRAPPARAPRGPAAPGARGARLGAGRAARPGPGHPAARRRRRRSSAGVLVRGDVAISDGASPRSDWRARAQGSRSRRSSTRR